MGSGIDVTQPICAVFGIFEGDSWYSAPEVMQMLGRFRKAKEWHVYIQPNRDGTYPTDWEEIYERNLQAANLTALDGDFDRHGLFVTSQKQQEIDRLLAKYSAERNRSRNNLLAHLVALAQDYGQAIDFQDGKAYTTGQAVYATKEIIDEEQKQLALIVDPVDDDEYDRYRQKGELSPEIRAGNNRYHIEQTVGQKITPEIYDNLHTVRQRATLVHFTDLKTDIAQLREYDQQEADERQNFEILKDRRHRSKRAQITYALLHAVWGIDQVDQLPAANIELTKDQIAERVQGWLDTHGEEFLLYFDRRACHSNDPVAILRWMLARIGLSLDQKRARDGGKLIYRYFLEQPRLQIWLGYSKSRLVSITEKQKKENVPKPATTYNSDPTADFGTGLLL
jgi:Fe-S-cluster formation regulator IscX/YfhJ